MRLKSQSIGSTVLGVALMLCMTPHGKAQGKKFDFAARHKAIKEKLEKSKGKIRNQAVHNPPMVKADEIELGDSEPVIGVHINKDARAYPLGMLFGGGGIFELLNDACGGEPIAASW